MKFSLRTKLILAVFSVFLVKSAISFFMQGPFIFSDEPCVVQKGIYLIEHMQLETCQNILQVDAGDPHPLYAMLVGLVYFFVKGAYGYHIVLLVNALLVATLVFPLFGIFRRFIGREGLSVLFAVVTVFLPQITAFDATLMTETLFIVINVWFTYAYLRSLDSDVPVKKRGKFKVLAIIFALLAALVRPFGFILFIALTINEFFTSDDRRSIAIVYIPLSIVMVGLTMFKLLPGIVPQLSAQLEGFKATPNPGLIVSVVKNQFNSFLVATCIAPILVVLMYGKKNDILLFTKMRLFFLSFIVMNFIIGVQHMLGGDGPTTDLLTRYIGMSLVYIVMLTFVFLTKYQKEKLDIITCGGIILAVTSLAFASYQHIKQTLALDIAIFYDAAKSGLSNSIPLRPELLIPFVVVCIALIVLFLVRKNGALRTALIAVFLLQTIFVVKQGIDMSRMPAPVLEYFHNTSAKVLFIEAKPENPTNSISFDYWKMLALSPNRPEFRFLLGVQDPSQPLELPKDEIARLQQEFTHIVSTLNLNLPKVATLDAKGSALRAQKEYIYAL